MTPDPSVPLKQFISRHIHSVEQLEILLLLQRTPNRQWRAEEVSKELATSRYAAEGRLMDLAARGLISGRQHDDELLFLYEAGGSEAETIVELARVYAERRTSVITMIFSKPQDSITSFADAFRLRTPPEKP